MKEISKKWDVILYSGIASAVCAALSFVGMFIAECCNKLGWEIGLTLSLLTFGCTGAFLLVLYVVPYVVRFVVECYQYFTRYR